MFKKLRGLALLFPTLLGALGSVGLRADVITQSASIPLTSTNFGAGSPTLAGQDPLDFTLFNTKGGTRSLDSATITLHATTHNDFSMHFVQSATITDTVATDYKPAPVPTVTIYEPDGTTPALLLQAATDPAVLTRTVTYQFPKGQTAPVDFSSSLPPTSPFYLAPGDSSASGTATLTAPATLALFTGSGPLSLPVTAAAFSKIFIDTGNGTGSVNTSCSADVTLTYNYHNVSAPQTVPEPASLVLWGLAGVIMLAVRMSRGRGTSVAQSA